MKESGTTVVQVGEGADENFLGYWWCEHYRQKYEAVYQPARRVAAWWQPFPRQATRRRRPASAARISRSSSAREARPGAVLGRRRVLVGRDARSG